MLQLSTALRGITALLLALGTVGSSAGKSPMSKQEEIIRLLNLKSGYCKGAAPPPDVGSANAVSVKTYVIRLSSVDTVKQQVSLDLWLVMSWTDSRLSWSDATDASVANVAKIFVPQEWLWLPDLTVNHPVEVRNYESGKFLAIVFRNGTVQAGVQYGVTSKCSIKMRRFPFDTQRCAVSFASATKTPADMQLQVGAYGPVNYTDLNSNNNEFLITNIETRLEPDQPDYSEYEKVSLEIEFKRKPLYYVTVLIVPSALILATCIFGFLLPADSGDRLALNVAILLSMSVFLQLAGSITPAQSESVPVLTWYFMVAMSVTTLSTVGSIIVHLCYRRAASGEAVSNRALRLLFLNRLFRRTTVRCGVASPASTSGSRSSIKESPEDPGVDWRHVGVVLDRLWLLIAVSLSVVIILITWDTAARS